MILVEGSSSPKGELKVTLTRGGVPLRQTFADAEGKFAFTQLTEGEYEVTIEGAGYQTHRHRVGLRYPGHEEERFSVRLVPLDSRAASEGGQREIPAKARKAFGRGLRSSQVGKHEDAAKQYAKAVALAPNYVQAWVQLGAEQRMLERWEESEKALGRALELDPRSAQASLNLGLGFLARGMIEPARNHLQETVEKDAQLGAPHLLLGVIAYQERRMDVAAGAFRRALELDPQGTAEAQVYLGSILAWQGEFRKAKRQLEEFLENNPAHPQAARAEKLLQEIRNFPAQATKP